MAQDNINEPAASIYRQAFEQVKGEIQAIPEENFVAVSLDIPATVITVQGAYPEIIALRPEFVAHLPTFEISKLDKLEVYALAMFCTQADYKAATEPAPSLVELANSAVETRTVLLSDVNALISRGLLAGGVIIGLQGVNGYKNLMMDIGTLAGILRKHAAKIAERTSVKPAELSAAEDLANRLGKAVGLRDQSPQIIAEASRNRQAAFTLFLHAYEEVRTGIHYLLRKGGDADSIAPSLYANRGLRRKPTDVNEDNPPAPGPASPTGNQPNTPGTNPAQPAKTADVSESGPFMH
jgi:hypothetical protein